MDKKEEKRQYMKLKRAKESEKKSLRLEQKKIINLRIFHIRLDVPDPQISRKIITNPLLNYHHRFLFRQQVRLNFISTEISRKRREKIKANPQLYAEQKEKERLRGIRRKESGAIKKVADMTSSEKKKFRKKKRENKAKERRNKCSKELKTHLIASTRAKGFRRVEHRLRRRVSNLEQRVIAKDKLISKLRMSNIRPRQTPKDPPIVENVKKIMKQGQSAVYNRLIYCEALVEQLKESKEMMSNEKERPIFLK
ncbi:hypothetical protein TKK_0000100 [Trichogramma kaykai]